ncbi:retrovirus-related pol polyprotein from transposon TNT 1-94, partial [Tanacetum coccineum]
SFLSRFMGEPSSSHLGAAKRVLRYVKGSLDLGIMFERNKVVKLEGLIVKKGPTVIFCGNKSAIATSENPVQHGRTKHINVKYHAIREAEKNE